MPRAIFIPVNESCEITLLDLPEVAAAAAIQVARLVGSILVPWSHESRAVFWQGAASPLNSPSNRRARDVGGVEMFGNIVITGQEFGWKLNDVPEPMLRRAGIAPPS